MAPIIERHPACFTGVGKLKDYQVKLHVDPNVPTVASPPRPIPFHLRERCRKELDKMERAGIIEDHHGPAPWVSNIVLSPKDDGGTRVTVDMRKPNEAIQATNIPIPRAEDIRAQLAGNKVFSKLDFKSAYHQLELDPESRYITVFNDGDKLKRYTRLTMGTKPASGELTKALKPLFASIEDVHVIHDDVIVASTSQKRHTPALEEILQKIEESSLTLTSNLDKCAFMEEEVQFWGMIVTASGVKPDPKKIEALRTAGKPNSKEEVMSFLCMVQANSDFLPDLALKTTHLRQLTKKHQRFVWSKDCQKEFEALKSALHDDALLRHFDISKKTFMFVDAHRTGLSAILAQGDSAENAKISGMFKPSNDASSIERRYPQLDLEALAIDFALRRYRTDVAGGPLAQSSRITSHSLVFSATTGRVQFEPFESSYGIRKFRTM